MTPLIIAQLTSEGAELLTAGKIGIAVIAVGKLVDIYNNYQEGKERKKHTLEFTKQTEILRSIDSTQKDVRASQLNDTQTIALATQRQGDMKTTLDRVDRNVRDLKTIAGIPDTETTHTRKTDVKTA